MSLFVQQLRVLLRFAMSAALLSICSMAPVTVRAVTTLDFSTAAVGQTKSIAEWGVEVVTFSPGHAPEHRPYGDAEYRTHRREFLVTRALAHAHGDRTFAAMPEPAGATIVALACLLPWRQRRRGGSHYGLRKS